MQKKNFIRNIKKKEFFYNPKFFLFLIFIFIIIILIYYQIIFNIFKKQQMKIIQNNIIKSHKIENLKTNIDNNKIKINNEKIKNIFQQKKNNLNQKDEILELKKYRFEKGEYVYAFVLNNNEENQNFFQEGIISKEYYEHDINFLPISIKGKHNKIFFNQKGDFIGISLPLQDKKSEINYIITSNLIFHLMNCFIWHDHNIDLFKKNEIMSKNTKQYISLSLTSQELNKQKQEEKKIQICLDQNCFFIGLKFNEKFLTINQIFNKYSLCLNCLKEITNNLIDEIDEKLIIEEKDDEKKSFSSDSQKEKEELTKKIKEISQITFLIYLKKLSLGSGIIYKSEKINNMNKYRYYIMTNRHVIEQDPNNEITTVFNKFFMLNKTSSLSFVNNQKDCDDIGILTFEEEINEKSTKKFQKVNKILDYAFPKDEQKIEIIQGEPIYSLGSQISILPNINFSLKSKWFGNNSFFIIDSFFDQEFYNDMIKIYKTTDIKNKVEKNLLKKGHVILFNDNSITFNIKIDNGNSGGPIFNKKGQILGINRSTIKNTFIMDEFTQSINIRHIKKILKEEYWQKNNFFQQKNLNFLKKEIFNFINDLQQNIYPNLPNPKINIFIDEFLNLFKEKSEKFLDILKNKKTLPVLLIATPIIPKNENEIQIMINLFKKIEVPEQNFYLDPTKEILEIELNIEINDKKPQFLIKLIKKNIKNKIIETKNLYFDLTKYSDDDINFQIIKDINSFISLELFHFIPENKINNQEKIKKSLIFWETKDNIEGNGVIIHKKKLDNGRFKYLVLSNYNGYVNFLDELKNIFSDYIEIITYRSNIYGKEKIKINSFYSNNIDNLVLMNFESDFEYEVAQITPISKISTGDKIYFIHNFNNENYFPHIFKSNIGNILEEKKSFFFDSVFNLKEKINLKNFRLNFLCFDKEGNFIGFNDNIKYKNNNSIPSHFIQGSFLKKENLLYLFIKSKLKDKLNVVFTTIFITNYLLFFLKLTYIKQNNSKKNEYIN
ncbi:trypsin-like peptidase domain-containing protein [Candidatus Phytoplasma oryzae]|nr:trypsin-like peptidase domain-containing protein [Candidatus Phytoplasma oryzae]